MVCIVAFVFVLIGSAVSAKYRRLLGRAWGCVWRRVTFRACDTTFRQDVKSSLLAPLAVRHPRLVKPASIAIEVAAWAMVLTMVVSLYLLGRSGLNLYVYGTCDKQNAQACSLAAEMCSIDGGTPGFWDSTLRGDVLGAFGNEFASLGETIAAVPSRMRAWDAADYAAPDATYLGGFRDGLPTAVEIIDPGCRFCAQLMANIHESGFADEHNLTYLVYPIEGADGPRFANSPLVARYLTAVRAFEAARGPATSAETADWYVLDQLFTGDRPDGIRWQTWMNDASPDEAETQLLMWLDEAGLSAADIDTIRTSTRSDAVTAELDRIRDVVENEVRTLAIPSMIAGGGLRSGLVDVETLQSLR